MFRMILVALFGSFLLVTPAQAAVDTAGAAHLKTVFGQYLADRKAAMKANHRDLRTEGPLTVEPANGYYAITLPHLTIVDADGSSTNVGIFAINAIPGAKPTEWKISLASPTPITGYNAAKAAKFKLTLGRQTFNGIWDETLQSFIKLDAQYQNVVVEQILDGTTIRIPKATIVYNLNPSADGKTWSGPIRYEMTNIESVTKGQAGISKIGSILMEMAVRDYDPVQAKAYQKKMTGLAEAAQKNPNGAMSADQVSSVYSALFDFVSTSFSGFDSRFTINDIALSRATAPTAAPDTFNVKQAVATVSMNGFRTGAVTVQLNVGYDGLAMVPPPPGLNETLPTKMKLDITTDKIPLGDLKDILLKNIKAQDMATTPEAKRAAGMEMAKLIPQVLSKAGTTLKVNPSSLSNKTYTMLMDGQLNADLKAVMGADGKMKLDVAGMDQLLKIVQEQLNDPQLTPLGKANLQKTLATMMVIQAIGQQGKNAQGQATRTYNIELTQQGKILLNGTDLSMLQMMVGAAPKAK